jgi:predicted ribosome quality control (RQC) complex YloA/Tae2 family protein
VDIEEEVGIEEEEVLMKTDPIEEVEVDFEEEVVLKIVMIALKEAIELREEVKMNLLKLVVCEKAITEMILLKIMKESILTIQLMKKKKANKYDNVEKDSSYHHIDDEEDFAVIY